jgi:RNA polymerase sigma factor (sigma-70 family)
MTLKLKSIPSHKEPDVRESELWNQFRKGSESAYIKIYDLHVQILYRYGLKLNKDKAFVKDCIQELFIDLWKKHALLGPTTSIKFYLFRSFRRKIHRSISNRFSDIVDLEEDYSSVHPSVEETIIALEEAESKKLLLLKRVQQLPKRQKEVIFLRYFEELSHDEVASIMCISKSSVYVLISRSIETLRKSFLFVVLMIIQTV